MKVNRSYHGFTLIEMSIVIIVVSLILAGVINTVGVQRQQLKRDETRQMLETIKEALIGFALTNGRLPCPDTGVDGLEDHNLGVTGPPPSPCSSDEGWLPHVDIGIGNVDVWGNRFRYSVTGSGVDNFADDPPHAGPPLAVNSSFAVDTDGTIVVNDNDQAAAGVSVLANTIPAIVLSYAENGVIQTACGGGLSARELENCDGDVNFVDSFYSDVNGQEYDDLVVWIPLTLLKSRMVEAALLP